MTRDRRIGRALVAGACLIAGVAIGWSLPRGGRAVPAGAGIAGVARPAGARQVFSPDIRHDPDVVQEQRKLLDMIERQCRVTGEHCAEARSLRRSIEADRPRGPR